MRPTIAAAAFFWFAGTLAFGQAGGDRLEFEVASIKPWAPPAVGGPGAKAQGRVLVGMRGGPGTSDPGQVTYSGLPLKLILTNAYDVRPYQISGPEWLDTERFDIVAKVPAGATREQARVMLQNLLADRFGLTLHHETKDSQVYELVVDKNGPKMKPAVAADAGTPSPAAPSSATPNPDAPRLGPPKLDKNGFPDLDRPGFVMMVALGPNGPRSRMVAKGQTVAELVKELGNQVNRPVVDKTGLAGKYDFKLEFTFEPGAGGPLGLFMPPPGALAGPGGLPSPGAGGGPPDGPVIGPLDSQADSAPSLFTALQAQLGLKLEAKKAPLDLLVIDHIEKTAAEN